MVSLRLSLVLFLSSAFTLSESTSCPPLTPRSEPPSNVRDLRIDDFAVIMAMGDSMSAGFNAGPDGKTDMKEHRGVSFSIGGDAGAITLPNFISSVKRNGELVGPAVGMLSQPQFKATCAGQDIDDVCRLSAAVDGSDLQDLIDLQVGYLNRTLHTASWAANVSVTRDWKLLTIFSGLDDTVFYNASDPTKQPTSLDLLAANLEQLLQAIHRALPRTYVNLMMLPELFDPSVTTSGLSCKFFKWYSEHAGIHWTATNEWISTIKSYNTIYMETAARWKSKQLDDFAVVLQPFMQNAPLTKQDMDTLDCFHPNLASHQGMALGLWNNMLAGSLAAKSTNWKVKGNATCPQGTSRLVV